MDDPALRVIREVERYLLTLEESAATLGISLSHLEMLLQQGRLTKLIFKGQPFIASYEVDWHLLRNDENSMLMSDENLFIGLNPHLMSLLQTPGIGATTSLYPSFHKDHITHIKDFLNRYLPRHYIAMTEPSLQIQGRQGDDSPFTKDSTPQPDVAIYHRYPASQEQQRAHAPAPTLELPLKLDELRTFTAINIYRTGEHEKRPVVRIELLSPTNMPGNRHNDAYMENRTKCLLANTTLIEIDYLHEYPSPVAGIPRYPQDGGAKAYNIAVTSPKTEKIEVYLFGIHEPLPVVTIPLADDEKIHFNFGEPYQYTWETSRFGMDVDYELEPVRMNRYSEADRQIIRQQMQVIQQKLKGSA